MAEHAGPLSAEQVATLAMSHIDTRLLRPVAADAGEAGDGEAVVQPVASPEERLGLALEEIRRAVVAELLDTLAIVTRTERQAPVFSLGRAFKPERLVNRYV